MFDLSTPSITAEDMEAINKKKHVSGSYFLEKQKMPSPTKNREITIVPIILVWLLSMSNVKTSCHTLG